MFHLTQHFYGLYHKALSTLHSAGNLINDDREVVVVYPRYYPGICLQELRKLTKTLRTNGVPSEARTEHVRDIYLGRYRYANTVGMITQ